MRIKGKKLLSSILAVAMTFGLVQPSVVRGTTRVEENEEKVGYEIYPNPHEVKYTGDEFVIRKDVNVVYDSTIDDATKNRMTEVLESKDKNITVSDEITNGKTNILVGTYSSGEYVDKYVQSNHELDSNLFEKYDSYYIASENGTISILGKNTDAAFYGITSLKHIFSQMDGSTILNFEMKDYADTPIRGFIEGYYGIPWTNEDRMSLMEFGGEFKMTSYIFAPKDDLYHTRKWRELYPEEELAAIAEMVEVGVKSKTKFVWTAHPFMGGFNTNDYDNEMIKLKAKFDQLYSVGVRQFGILGDDVGNLDKQIVVNMMNELSEWGKEKGDVYDFVFCPAGYNASWQGDYSELNIYDAQFPEDVQIFWTGNSVCAPVSQDTLTNFKTHRLEEGKDSRRSPLFWLNWPVNDINMKRLMMGKGSLLHTNINIEDLAGVVTNPMQDAEPSKVSLFAIADYAWNVKGFDDDKSWEDSFKYIDSDASEALHTIAKHTSDPAPNGHGLVLEESEEIKPLLDEFKTKLSSGESLIEVGTKLVNEMNIIIEASDEFINTSNNARMVEQITPFANSLKDLATSIKDYVNAAMNLEEKDNESAIQNFADGTVAYENSKNHDRPTINGSTKAQPGSKRLVPFAEAVRDGISNKINALVNGGENLVITPSTNISNIYSGNIENIVDGKADTFIWNGEYEAVGQYYQISLSKPTTIYGVDILNGTPSKKDDTFGTAKVQYTTDGTTWQDINSKTYGPYAESVKISGIEIDNVVGLRYICTEAGSGRKWPAMREFSIATSPQESEGPTFTSEVIRTTDGWSVYSGKDSDIIDGDETTGVHYNVRQNGNPVNTTIAGDYVGVRLSEPIILGKINIIQGQTADAGDWFKDATLEYSLDGKNYTPIERFENKKEIRIDLSSQEIEAQYVRLRNNVKQETWIGFREFEVNSKVYHNGKVYTNVEKYKEHPADYYNDNASIVELQNVTLENGEYIGLKLDRIHELTEAIVKGSSLENLTLQVSKNAHEWTNIDSGSLTENNDARYIRLVNLTNNAVTFDLDEFKVLSREFGQPTVSETNMGTIAEGKIENLFDKDRTTGLKYQKTQAIGDYMILDLGQEIDLNELKLVTHDSDKDYIRDGLVYASANKSEWGEPIITLGDQLANTESDDSTINESFPEHEISYNIAKATDINKKARYIKIEITQPYSYRWTKLNEVEINNGEYIPTVNDPTFESNVADTEKGLYEYLIDGDITTMYIPNKDTGYLVYSLSEKTEVNHIRVMQNAKQISNAEVKVRIAKTNKNTDEWITLGRLNKATNEFILPVGTNVLEVKFEWSGVTPNLVELSMDSVLDVNVDKQKLEELINENLNTEDWTTNSANAYKEAIEVANEIKENNYVAQATVDSAIKEIEKAKENKALKGDSTKLQDEIDNAIANDDSSKYTGKTWANYQKALNAAKKAMEDANNLSEADITKLIDELNSAKSALVYNPTNREEAEIIVEDVNEFMNNITDPEKTYTINSWNLLKDRKIELEALIELNKTEPQDPSAFETTKDSMLNAKNSLVNVESLSSLIDEFDAITDSSIYTETSYKAYENAINKAKEVMINGTIDTVKQAEYDIKNTKNNLELIGSSESIKKYISELKKLDKVNYTNNSYKALMDRVVEIESMDLDGMSEEELKGYEKELLSLRNSLVNVSALHAKVETAKGFKADLYTTSSYNALMALVNSANEEFVSGSEDSVQDLINKIDVAIKNLVTRVDNKELVDYVNGIEEIDLTKYTEESAAKYAEALSILKSMLENADNTAATDFVKAKNNFEDAKENLELKPDTNPGEGEGNPGTGEENPGGGEGNPGAGEGNPEAGEENPGAGEENPGTGENTPGSGENSSENNNGKNEGVLPETGGVNSTNVLLFGFILVSAGVVFIFNKKRKLAK
ncbi:MULTISPECIES: beta-N-acetylglucosaminidase domain-containing protein [Clostridium]|uniref:beta-N-acetylglucosaminidase domain-containing protein n=2 Tax=Clostridiaceae TaxID=31979 RepID=UPI001156E44F|nr:beta-N-acetylglucosaminidase domain-containing protein [Clostridium sp.]MDU1277460.1 beta-N-acetylglucosaminidase domain-containing protein [Clostridium sp.]MDU1567186.1 beta-N-acetylglucosaminidase domain-containing protein [Clostridium sp.]MDU3524414.1 beta-N-acetylglucosaminidase domain-containing protein [Clostridium sp.]MDU4736605.1 beta-N-acetylglucosaminidase domain-containing protein [Clostridium sp.]MDU7087018.1 beta-N-acetylglucosaminidase domain-containing protein [Clostridium sp